MSLPQLEQTLSSLILNPSPTLPSDNLPESPTLIELQTKLDNLKQRYIEQVQQEHEAAYSIQPDTGSSSSSASLSLSCSSSGCAQCGHGECGHGHGGLDLAFELCSAAYDRTVTATNDSVRAVLSDHHSEVVEQGQKTELETRLVAAVLDEVVGPLLKRMEANIRNITERAMETEQGLRATALGGMELPTSK